jgi:hypothetical protein
MLRMEGRAPRKCPLYPQKRTFSEAAQMSAKCQERTFDNYETRRTQVVSLGL